MTYTGTVTFICAMIIALGIQNTNADQDWHQFLGPNGDSEATGSSPSIAWKESDFVWTAEIPGTGWSSPVYSDNKIWLTSAITKSATPEQIAEKRKGVQFANMKTAAGSVELKAVCIDLKSGKVLHNILLDNVENPELINPMNSYASPTAAIANGKVICHFGADGTWCLDASSGEKIWETKYVINHSVGAGSSPMIHKDKVILVCDGIDQQFIAAVSLDDGKEVWKTKRPAMRNDNGEFQKAYSTPLFAQVNGKVQAIIPGAQWIVAYDPDNGKEIWRADHGEGFSVTPMASFEDGMVLFSTGFMRPEVIAIDPTGAGDVTQTHIKWRTSNGPNMPSMITSDGKAYFLSDRGILSCVDVMSGETIGRKRIGGNFSATPLLAGGNLYLCSREGKVTIVKADPSLEIVGSHEFGEKILATPAPINNDLIFRVGSQLIRVGKNAG